MDKFINLIGQKFGKLTPIKKIGTNNNGNAIWLCVCDCGKEKPVTQNHLIMKNTQSCGCLYKNNKNNLKHGHKSFGETSKTYMAWQNMKRRCYNKKDRQYKDYGGRGVTVCNRWMDFKNFLKDVGEIPGGFTLDRTNNNGNYCPKNCRLSTTKEQNKNRRNSILPIFNNKKITLKQLSEKYNIPYMLLWRRICRDKWPVRKAILTPLIDRAKS